MEAEQLQSDLEKPDRLLQRKINVVEVDKSVSDSAQNSELQEYDDDAKIVSTAEAASMEKRTQSATSRLLLNGLGQAQEQPLSFMIVTGERSSPCKTAIGSNIMMKTYKNKVDYCNLHGCKVWYALEVWEKGFTGTWVRYPLLLRLMKANPSVTWFMWMDSDAIFTDLNFSIPFDTYNGWNKNFVVSGFWEKVYTKEPDWMAVNAGVFLIRNCEWSYTFLQNWSALGAPENIVKSKEAMNSVIKSRPQDWDPDDQSALVYLLNQNRKESEVKTFLEAGYSLHGYWDYIVDTYEDIMQGKEKRPFVTHFCGCNFCGGLTITDRCSQGFERAFNFADNQLLAFVGLRHSNLSTSSLQPISSLPE